MEQNSLYTLGYEGKSIDGFINHLKQAGISTLVDVLVTSTGASTRIEGARLSDEDVEKLMRGISIQKFTRKNFISKTVGSMAVFAKKRIKQ